MVIERYSKKWAMQFDLIKEILSKTIINYMKIEHVGSTSIPGMYAKPIIDIDVVLKSRNDFDRCEKSLLQLGYIYVGNQGIDGREVFKRNEIEKFKVLDEIKHHLYVFSGNNKEYLRHIKFRDVLIGNELYRNEYNNIKFAILEKVGNENRDGYVEMKETKYKWFFEKVLMDKSNK